ncbi:MAG TPA: hypothetical protein VGS19_04585 [Streptosporangiaceae bacterium]|nr:hypothetical protein [Streptosporangiaceae bacterium]
MNLQMADDLVRYHIRDIRHQAAQCGGRARRRPGRPGSRDGRWGQRLRSRVGFTLIEAGLYLVAAPVRPVPHD